MQAARQRIRLSVKKPAPPAPCWTKRAGVSMIAQPPDPPVRPIWRGLVDVLNKIFGWWNGATIGTLFTIAKRGRLVGTDENGNRYYESRDTVSYDGRRRRWVTYNGYAEASKVSPDWYGWLHYTFAEPPTVQPLPRRSWEKDHLPNLTGTPLAWRPPGSLANDGKRPAATGDYQAWTPE
jgi:NADH:ubiquinone oxidoreductase subunit